MDSSILLSVSTSIYGLSAMLYVASLVFRRSGLAVLGRYFAYFGILIITSGISLRWFESYAMGIGHAPLSNLYESLIFFAWTIAVIYVFFEKKHGNVFIGSVIMPAAFLSIAYASLSPNISDSIQPLVPALQSNWLITHVVTCFFGYASFTISFGLSVIYLLRVRFVVGSSTLMDFFPEPDVMGQLNYQMVTFGFLFLSIGIITGAVWANSAWGSYWSWDPKETWSLITWLVYAALIHTRLIRSWGDRKVAYISIIGFAAVLFTYFGVNYLQGLHSYAVK